MRVAMGAGGAPRKLRERGGEKGPSRPPGLRARGQLLSPRRLSRPLAAYSWRRGREGGKG